MDMKDGISKKVMKLGSENELRTRKATPRDDVPWSD
jgi:hypothetical protein